jgi:hypothetical protein
LALYQDFVSQNKGSTKTKSRGSKFVSEKTGSRLRSDERFFEEEQFEHKSSEDD